jgi:hypothetical protein
MGRQDIEAAFGSRNQPEQKLPVRRSVSFLKALKFPPIAELLLPSGMDYKNCLAAGHDSYLILKAIQSGILSNAELLISHDIPVKAPKHIPINKSFMYEVAYAGLPA